MNLHDILKHHRRGCLYHFTDTRNLSGIRQAGGLCSLKKLVEGDAKGVIFGSNETSRGIDRFRKIDNYVRLCFDSQHPMEYIAREKEGRIGNVTWLKISLDVLDLEGVKISNGVAYAGDAKIYNLNAKAVSELDWAPLFTRVDYKDTAMRNRVIAARKYEILVPDFIPSKHILNLNHG